MVSRFAPQVQVFILAMPIKSVLAILILVFFFWRLLPYATDQLGLFDPFMQRFYEMMRFASGTVTNVIVETPPGRP
jgi:type III secretion protein T